MEGGKERDDLPYAEGAAAHTHTNNVHINTQALHACHVHLINLSSLLSHFVQEGLLFLCDPHLEFKDVRDLLPLNWLLAAAFPPYASCMYLRKAMLTL